MFNETSLVDQSQQATTGAAPINKGEVTTSRQDPGERGEMEREEGGRGGKMINLY